MQPLVSQCRNCHQIKYKHITTPDLSSQVITTHDNTIALLNTELSSYLV